jgi:arsenate reductase
LRPDVLLVMKPRVLVLCTGNSARSQMAEGLLRHRYGDRLEVESAGSRPSRVHPEAIAAMAEIGIDISGQRSKHVDEFAGQAFDWVMTVCDQANETCPVFPGNAVRLHHDFPDPADPAIPETEIAQRFRVVRDLLSAYLESAESWLRSSR